MVGAVYLDIQGVTAHTTRGSGASAIEELAHKVLELQGLSDPERGVLVNVGTIEAGSARQVIPDRAKAAVDLRAPDAATGEELLGRVREIAERQWVPRTSTTLRGGVTRPPFETGAGTRELMEIARQAALGLDMTIEGEFTRGGSDGSFTAAIGVPTLDGLGPEGANSCSRDEYIVLDSLPRRAALLAAIIAALPDLAEEE
jgi:glutamate carboxypeptidase